MQRIHPAAGGTRPWPGCRAVARPDPDKAKDDPDRWLWTVTVITTDATGPAGEIIWGWTAEPQLRCRLGRSGT